MGRRRSIGYYRPTVDKKDHKFMIDVRNFFDQSIKYEPKRMEIL